MVGELPKTKVEKKFMHSKQKVKMYNSDKRKKLLHKHKARKAEKQNSSPEKLPNPLPPPLTSPEASTQLGLGELEISVTGLHDSL